MKSLALLVNEAGDKRIMKRSLQPTISIVDYAFVKEAKKNFFHANGYDIIDSDFICQTIKAVALRKYVAGDFKLGMLDKHGQRITIRVELPGRTGQGTTLTFHTGWMVYPGGKIVLTTPATELSKK